MALRRFRTFGDPCADKFKSYLEIAYICKGKDLLTCIDFVLGGTAPQHEN